MHTQTHPLLLDAVAGAGAAEGQRVAAAGGGRRGQEEAVDGGGDDRERGRQQERPHVG